MSKLTLVIGNKNYSSWSLRPWVLMKHCGIPFEEIVIPLYEPGAKEKLLKHSPGGKVPILKDDKLIIWESLAIAEYLADLFPDKNLWPKDRARRAWARSVSNEMHAGFTALRKNCPMNVRGSFPGKGQNEDVERDVKRITAIWQECRETFKNDGDFLFGSFSIADAMYAPVVYRFNTYGIETSGTAKKYMEMMLNIPALKEWTAAAKKETWVVEQSEPYAQKK